MMTPDGIQALLQAMEDALDEHYSPEFVYTIGTCLADEFAEYGDQLSLDTAKDIRALIGALPMIFGGIKAQREWERERRKTPLLSRLLGRVPLLAPEEWRAEWTLSEQLRAYEFVGRFR